MFRSSNLMQAFVSNDRPVRKDGTMLLKDGIILMPDFTPGLFVYHSFTADKHHVCCVAA